MAEQKYKPRKSYVEYLEELDLCEHHILRHRCRLCNPKLPRLQRVREEEAFFTMRDNRLPRPRPVSRKRAARPRNV